MNRDPASLNHYLDTVESIESRGNMCIGATPEGDGYILAGNHGKQAWCWCQPVVIDVPCTGGKHLSHPQINHRRTMDEDVLEDENELGFYTNEGQTTTYPKGQTCVGPGDRPN